MPQLTKLLFGEVEQINPYFHGLIFAPLSIVIYILYNYYTEGFKNELSKRCRGKVYDK